MKSRTERSTARGQKKMEGVNMPASLKFAWRWLVGATAATIFSVVALPGVGQADYLTICIQNSNGRIKGINISCNPNQTELDWYTVGPAGPTGAYGVPGDPGLQGSQGQQGAAGPQGPAGGQGAPGPQGYAGSAGYSGPVGPSGAMGAAGPQGVAGWAGTPGSVGPSGPMGAAGPQGPQGEAGPTGPTGPAGFMGEDGIRGPTGLVGPTGATGPSGLNGAPEPNISVFTGGSLGTLGFLNGTDLSGNNSVFANILVLGPGNGSDSSANSGDSEVPMSEAGDAYRLFVNVDTDPGTQANNGIPSTFWFFLCNDNGFPGSCNVSCYITGPDTTCSDTADNQMFSVGDYMSLWAFADYPGANHANVKWSVTYDHGKCIGPNCI